MDEEVYPSLTRYTDVPLNRNEFIFIPGRDSCATIGGGEGFLLRHKFDMVQVMLLKKFSVTRVDLASSKRGFRMPASITCKSRW